MTQWTVNRGETYDRKVKHPDGTEETVTFRPLDAGDRAEFNEIKILAEGEGSVQTGRIQLMMVERSIVRWTLEQDGAPLPPTLDVIRSLDPNVFDQLYEHVSFGKPKAEPEQPKQLDGLTVLEGKVREREDGSPLSDAAVS